jgi:hypothetical protein
MSQENSDPLALQFLAAAGIDLPDDVASLGELDAEAVAAACGGCLNIIFEAKGEEQRFPTKLASNPGVRFRVCTSLATAISGLGFPGELGFSQILYPSEAETRRILLFLVDQMPKGGQEGDGAGGALAAGPGSFDDQVRNALQDALAVSWVPVGWLPRRVPKVRHPGLRRAWAHAGLLSAKRAQKQAALEARLQTLSGGGGAGATSRAGGFGDPPAEWTSDGAGAARVRYGGGFGRAEGRLAHEARFAHDEGGGFDVAAAAGAVDGETAAQRAERAERDKLQALLGELEAIHSAIEEQKGLADSAKAAEAALVASVRQLEGEVRQSGIEQQRREVDQQVRRRALELATDPDGSRKRLQAAIAQSAASLMELAEEWEGHRGPLLAQIRDAQLERQLRREGAAKKMGEVKTLRADMRAMVRDLGERDEAIGRLTAETGKAKGAPRASYTERIMDVVRNVRKQRAGIEEILADIRESQKEVNTHSERLQRSFSAADEIIFREASTAANTKAGATSKACYKSLARMHEAFGNLVEHVQTIANSAAATGELQGKIAELEARNTNEAIERVNADLKVMKAENSKLVAGGAAVAASG